jgi:hypothetical protein
MRIVVVGDVAVTVPEGVSPWRAAEWINPGIIPDEFQEFDVIELTARELEDLGE